MAARLSRRKIASFMADSLTARPVRPEAIRELAAYLVESRRVRELDLIVRDIEDALALRGVTITDVTSAYPLTDSIKKEIAGIVGGKLELREEIDPSVLGGVRIAIPGKQFDGTIRRKLTALKAKQV
jgi:F-type H+-transporting ATPase subunit delta